MSASQLAMLKIGSTISFRGHGGGMPARSNGISAALIRGSFADSHSPAV